MYGKCSCEQSPIVLLECSFEFVYPVFLLVFENVFKRPNAQLVLLFTSYKRTGVSIVRAIPVFLFFARLWSCLQAAYQTLRIHYARRKRARCVSLLIGHAHPAEGKKLRCSGAPSF